MKMNTFSPVATLLFWTGSRFSFHSFLVLVLSTVLVSPSSPSNDSSGDWSPIPDSLSTGHLNLYNAALLQKLYFSTHLKILKNPSVSVSELNKLRELCLFQTANSLRKLDVARGYDCLVQLFQRNNSKSEKELYKAIKIGSYGLETFYTKNAALNVYKLIVSGYENSTSLLPRGISAQCCAGYREKEESFLETILSRNISNLNSRIMFRKSLISTFGRSSSREGPKKINLELAIDQVTYVRNVSQIEQNNILDIAMVFNEKYVVHAAVTILSALMNSDLDSFYRFHIVMDPNDQISEASKSKLASFHHIRKYSIDFVTFPNEVVSEEIKIKMKFNHLFPLMVIYRLYLYEVFPTLDSMLYIDADLIVFRDLNELKRIDMNDYMWGAALDKYYHPEDYGCNALLPNFYINAGVLVLNLKKMRELDANNMILNNLPAFGKCPFRVNDQDIINTVFADYINYIPYRWNGQPTPDNAVKELFSTFILHFAGPKPWVPEFEALFRNDTSKVPSYYQHYWWYREVVDSFIGS